MQEFSFDPSDPVLDIGGWRLALQVITFENTYGIAPAAVEATGGGWRFHAAALRWAGGSEVAPGTASIDARRTDDGIEARVSVSAAATVRCTKLIVSGLPRGELIGHRWAREPVRRTGTVVHYPSTTHTPLVFLDLGGGEHLYFESLDTRVRAKRFAVIDRDDGVAVELIHEDAAHEMTARSEAPAWRLGRTRDPRAVTRRHEAHADAAFGVQPWETRGDVPPWAREIALALTLHGMHWSGYIFNTYDDMRGAIDYVAERIDGRRVLAYLPGWEGRYYWQYGDYRPEPRLGGEAAFARLAARAADLGVRLMPMFGANCANANLPGFADWGAPAEMRSPSGLAFQGNRPDWDASRAHDPGWQVWLNPGAPSWRSRLVAQVSALTEAYALPAAFFDTQHVWVNDPRHDLYAGLAALRDELKTRFPDLLVAGEGWYDALGAVTPLSHSNTPAQWPEGFARGNRTFLHLSAGDPSRGSTGVHELGYSAFALAPDAPHVIPTLPIVDGTIARAPDGVARVIEQAKAYARRYL